MFYECFAAKQGGLRISGHAAQWCVRQQRRSGDGAFAGTVRPELPVERPAAGHAERGQPCGGLCRGHAARALGPAAHRSYAGGRCGAGLRRNDPHGKPVGAAGRFHIGGRGQGHNAEHQQRAYRGACTGAHEMHESHPCMLCHGVAAVPAVYCGAGYGRAALVGAHGRPCTVRRGAVGRVRVGGSAGPHRRRRACQKRLVFSAFAPFLGADRACLFSKLHGDQRHGLDGDISRMWASSRARRAR